MWRRKGSKTGLKHLFCSWGTVRYLEIGGGVPLAREGATILFLEHVPVKVLGKLGIHDARLARTGNEVDLGLSDLGGSQFLCRREGEYWN